MIKWIVIGVVVIVVLTIVTKGKFLEFLGDIIGDIFD